MDNVAINLGRRFDLDRRKSRLSEIRETTADGIQRFNQVRNRNAGAFLATPSSTYSPPLKARDEESGRIAVPAFPRKKICLLDRKVSAAAFHLHNRTVVGGLQA